MTVPTGTSPTTLWDRYVLAVDDVSRRLARITSALESAVPYAIVGGQGVALWVATKDPAAVRTTKDVDILLRRGDLPKARAAARGAGFDYFEVVTAGMFMERDDPHPRHAVHLVWAGEKVKADDPLPSPSIEEREEIEPGRSVVLLRGLVCMKLMANRDQDRVHLRDMIDAGLVGRDLLAGLPPELAERLEILLTEQGR